MKKHYLLLLLPVFWFANTFLQCKGRCEEFDVAVSATGLSLSNLDNRGAAPVPIAPGGSGWRNAYGFRVSGTGMLPSPMDTVGLECPHYVLAPSTTQVAVITKNDFSGQFPAGTVVSSLFKYAAGNQYYDLSEAAGFLNQEWARLDAFSTDFFLLQSPDAPGWQQFELQIQLRDSSTLSVLTDSIYLQ